MKYNNNMPQYGALNLTAGNMSDYSISGGGHGGITGKRSHKHLFDSG